jgi:hypothetical protein
VITLLVILFLLFYVVQHLPEIKAKLLHRHAPILPFKTMRKDCNAEADGGLVGNLSTGKEDSRDLLKATNAIAQLRISYEAGLLNEFDFSKELSEIVSSISLGQDRRTA